MWPGCPWPFTSVSILFESTRVCDVNFEFPIDCDDRWRHGLLFGSVVTFWVVAAYDLNCLVTHAVCSSWCPIGIDIEHALEGSFIVQSLVRLSRMHLHAKWCQPWLTDLWRYHRGLSLASWPGSTILGIRSAGGNILYASIRRGVQSTRCRVPCHPFTLHYGQAWQQISGREGDAPVTLQGMLKPSPYCSLVIQCGDNEIISEMWAPAIYCVCIIQGYVMLAPTPPTPRGGG